MSDFQMDDHELGDFIRSLDTLQTEFPTQARAVMRRVGNKAKAKVKSVARSSVQSETGNYIRAITRGKVWAQDGDTYNVRVYPKSKIAPHAHLIEYGFIHTGHEPGKKRGSFVPGKHVYENATNEFEADFEATMATEFARIVNKLP